MAFLNFGAAKAAAHRIDFQGMIKNLSQQEQLTNVARQKEQEEVRYYSDKLKKGTSNNPYINHQLSKVNDAVGKELAQFEMDNPGWKNSYETHAQWQARNSWPRSLFQKRKALSTRL